MVERVKSVVALDLDEVVFASIDGVEHAARLEGLHDLFALLSLYPVPSVTEPLAEQIAPLAGFETFAVDPEIGMPLLVNFENVTHFLLDHLAETGIGDCAEICAVRRRVNDERVRLLPSEILDVGMTLRRQIVHPELFFTARRLSLEVLQPRQGTAKVD